MSRYKNLKTFKNQELGRLAKSLKDVKRTYLKDNYGKVPFKDYEKFCLVCDVVIPILTLLKISNVGMSVFDIDKEKNRPNYDLVEGITRGLIKSLFSSKLLSNTLSSLKADSDNIIKSILELGWKHKMLLGRIKKVLDAANKALAVNEQAAKLYARYTGEEEEDAYSQEKTLVYTSYKTFETEKEFEGFLTDYSTCMTQAFEIIIVDFIDIYLKLTKDDFIAIFNGFTIQAPFKLVDNTDAIRLAMEVQQSIKESYKDGTLSVLLKFLNEALESYLDDFEEEQEDIRGSIHTQNEQEHFIALFENGSLFK